MPEAPDVMSDTVKNLGYFVGAVAAMLTGGGTIAKVAHSKGTKARRQADMEATTALAVLSEDVATLKTDVSNLRDSMSDVKETVARIEGYCSAMHGHEVLKQLRRDK